jgi:hypothetical protein
MYAPISVRRLLKCWIFNENNMRLVHAMTLRDGGTTSVTVSLGLFRRVSYTIDYSLPWDGRRRFVFRGPAFTRDDSHRLEIGSEAEREVQR